MHPDRNRRSSRWFFGLVLLIGFVYVVGTLSGNGDDSTASSSTSSSDSTWPPGLPPGEITVKDYNGIAIGYTLSDVKLYLGNPADEQVTVTDDLTSRCLYWEEADNSPHHFQFCFDNGTLTSKARY